MDHCTPIATSQFSLKAASPNGRHITRGHSFSNVDTQNGVLAALGADAEWKLIYYAHERPHGYWQFSWIFALVPPWLAGSLSPGNR